MLKLLSIVLLVFIHSSFADEKFFKDSTAEKSFMVTDTISDNPINNQIVVVYKKNSIIGFYRNIHTTTGCNSACLPLSYTAYYDHLGKFLTIKSKDGLTKINHTPFSKEDYGQIDFILALNPSEFKSITHPKELTDAISGATLKVYQNIVVPGAAYSTLRIHLYNQDTLLLIKKYSEKETDLLK